jgi:hypothetical protein
VQKRKLRCFWSMIRVTSLWLDKATSYFLHVERRLRQVCERKSYDWCILRYSRGIVSPKLNCGRHEQEYVEQRPTRWNPACSWRGRAETQYERCSNCLRNSSLTDLPIETTRSDLERSLTFIPNKRKFPPRIINLSLCEHTNNCKAL